MNKSEQKSESIEVGINPCVKLSPKRNKMNS